MIDINELRRKISSVDIVDHVDIHANVKPTLTELIDRIEAAEKERDALRAMIKVALEVLDNVRGNINPERGYADELEVDIKHAITTITSLAQRKTP